MRYFGALVLALILASPAFAAFQGPGSSHQGGGFSGPGSNAAAPEVSVQQAVAMPHDARVVLTGSIISQIPGSKDEYMFRDGSGEVRVEISQKYFQGHTVTPANVVRIYGEVEKDFAKPVEIDVKRLEVLK